MSKQLKAPDGTELLGVLQHLPAYSECSGLDDSGEPAYIGGTEPDWDGLEELKRVNPKTDRRERVWLDRDGGEWFESDLVEDTDDEDDEDDSTVDCPVFDPDCLGGDGDCHDACERPETEEVLQLTEADIVTCEHPSGICDGTCTLGGGC